MSKPPAVVVDQLTKTFGTFVAVNHVSFSVEQGEIFGFLGPNGSGKTTTIRMLCGVLSPSEGAASVLGLDLATQTEQIKGQIGYMAQKFALYNDLTARENLEFYADIYGLPSRDRRARVAELIAMAGLEGREKERVSQLSGAWKQRLALGCSIVHRPALLFLDEPTAGVDPSSRRRFWEMIYGLAGQGVTIFVTTHYMDEAERCNRVALMYNSNLLTIDEPDVLKGRMPGLMLEIDARPTTEAMDVLLHQPGVEEVVAHGHLLHATVGAAASASAHARLTGALRDAGIAVERMDTIEPSLEDVFISMIDSERRAQARAALGEGPA